MELTCPLEEGPGVFEYFEGRAFRGQSGLQSHLRDQLLLV